MITVLLTLFLACLTTAAPAAEDPATVVSNVFNQIIHISAEQRAQDARTAARLDKTIESLAPRILALGTDAVLPLNSVLKNRNIDLKTRTWAISFLGLLHTQAAFAPLEHVLADSSENPLLRAAAAQELSALNPHRAGTPLCAALKEDNIDVSLAREIVHQLAYIGCGDITALELFIGARGARPHGMDEIATADAVRALSSSRPPVPARAVQSLLNLLEYYPIGAASRADIMEALLSARTLLALVREKGEPLVARVLIEESSNPRTARAAIRLLTIWGGPLAQHALLRQIKNSNPSIIADAAEALDVLAERSAIGPLEEVLAHAHNDPRFTPRPNLDVAGSFKRIETALQHLRSNW